MQYKLNFNTQQIVIMSLKLKPIS